MANSNTSTIYFQKDNTIFCVISFLDYMNKEQRFEGKATCNANDTFNEEFGKDLAHKRAMFKVKEYDLFMASQKLESLQRDYNRLKKSVAKNEVQYAAIKKELKAVEKEMYKNTSKK